MAVEVPSVFYLTGGLFMAVSNFHRFLSGKDPLNAGVRIWVLHGSHLHDWFFHNELHGSVFLQRTLELWGIEQGLELTVSLTEEGQLDFSGNPNPAEAARRFENALNLRPPRYGTNFSRRAPDTQQQTNANSDNAAQARQAAEDTQQALGGEQGGTALINTMRRLSRFLTTETSSGLVIIKDFPDLLDGLDAPALRQAEKIMRRQWHDLIKHGKFLVFLLKDKRPLEQFLSEKFYPRVNWSEIGKPSDNEVHAALERLAIRHQTTVSGGKAISRILAGQEKDLELALGKVINLIQRGEQTITAGKILDLPPVNEQAIAEVVAELHSKTGWVDLKAKVDSIINKARSTRRDLLEGNSLPEEETMHLVFFGPPGTGKTSAAKTVARLFNALGLLRKSEPKEVIASEIISSNVGESGENMRRIIEEARGGVLFIDEAHQMGDKESHQAKEIINALVPLSLNLRNELVIILAGYADQMHALFEMDPGMPRRFPDHGHIMFNNFTQDELWRIFQGELSRRGYTMEQALLQRTRNLLDKRSKRPSFGNAGGAINLVNEIIERNSANSPEGRKTIIADDLPPLVKRNQIMADEAWQELNAMLGMATVRDKLRAIIDGIRYDLEEEEHGTGTGDVVLHPGNMRFVGPPGTGKTTIARLMPKLLHGIGCIDRPVFVEISPGALRGQYLGSAGIIVRNKVAEARDGVFFIDEAYGLAGGEHDPYGKQAIEELLQQITRPENKGTVFIIAGYKAPMDRFISSNEGLARRFLVEVEFPNFSADECVELACNLLSSRNHTWEEGVPERMRTIAVEARQRMGDQFGNAGWVKDSLVNGILSAMRSRVLAAAIPPGTPERRRVTLADLPAGGPDYVETAPPQQPEQIPELLQWNVAPQYRVLPHPDPQRWAADPSQQVAMLEATSFLVQTVESDGTGTATGFFVSPDGIMATCAHVVRGASRMTVYCAPGRQPVPARLVFYNAELDLALLHVECAPPVIALPLDRSLPLAPLADLIAYGNSSVQPGEPGRAVRARVSRNDQNNQRHFESDGGIEQGYSGGPVLDAATGLVVGIVSAGRGEYTKEIIRAEQLLYLLEDIGYSLGD
jgi:AAA+ superfamily predicted ATPase